MWYFAYTYAHEILDSGSRNKCDSSGMQKKKNRVLEVCEIVCQKLPNLGAKNSAIKVLEKKFK
jgi:hypothetical protein